MNPTIPLKTKYSVADKVFPAEMRSFMKTVCRYQKMGLIREIFAAYDRCREKQAGIINARLYCVTPPGEAQKKGSRHSSAANTEQKRRSFPSSAMIP